MGQLCEGAADEQYVYVCGLICVAGQLSDFRIVFLWCIMNSRDSKSLSRRDLLRRSALALGTTACATALLPSTARGGTFSPTHPLYPKAPHFAPKAKRVILFFMNGGVSHVDTFDPKEGLRRDHGKIISGSAKLLASPWKTNVYASCGTQVTELFPQLGACMDDIALIRSMYGDHGDHFAATLGMHTGSNGEARPGIGAWLSYGLGTHNPNLPSHVVFAPKDPYAGTQVWDANFLPAYHQGVRVTPGSEPIANLKPALGDVTLRSMEEELFDRVNQIHLAKRTEDQRLKGRMLSFQTARGLQSQAPEVFDLREESDASLSLYGVQRGDAKSFAWQCLMARRLAERGVRFIEVIDANNWDAHGNIKDHEKMARNIDQPIAGLIRDLKSRGMFEETLIVWCTEFGRTPAAPGGGRDHHKAAFSCWLAGAGVKGGVVYGASDEYGLTIAENPVHVHDFHATILHLAGLDHEKLTFRYGGRDFRLTDVHGNIVKDVIA